MTMHTVSPPTGSGQYSIYDNNEVARIQADTGIGLEDARMLYLYRQGQSGCIHLVGSESLRRCEQLEKQIAKNYAKRVVPFQPRDRGDDREYGRGDRGGDYTRGPTPTSAPTTAQTGPHVPWTVPLMTWRDPATIPRRQFLYGYFYARGVLSAMIADGGIGKSLLKLVEILAVVTGRPLLDITPQHRVRALYWNGDDPYVEVERRLHAICKHYGINLKELLDQGWLSIGRSDQQPLCLGEISRGSLILNPNAVNDICALIKDRSLGLVCFDPFKSMHHIPENDNTNMEAIADALKTIGIRSNAAIAVDHHVRKPAYGQNEVTTADARGASALINKARLCRVCNAMTSQQAIQARLKEGERKYYFRADVGKVNIAEPGDDSVWFRKLPVLCDNGEYTPVITSWTYPNAFDSVTPAHMHRVRDMAANGNYRKDPQADNWIGNTVAEVLDLDPSDEADKKQIKAILKKWFANGVLDVKTRPDENRMKRSFVVPGNWNEDEPATNESAGEPASNEASKASNPPPPYRVLGSAPGARCIACGAGGGVKRIHYAGVTDPWHVACVENHMEVMGKGASGKDAPIEF
jgi:hypothetical protein